MHQVLFSSTHRSGLESPSFLLWPPLTLRMQVPSVILSPPHVGIRQLWSPNLSSVMASDMWPSHCEPFQWRVKQPQGSCLGGRSGTLAAQISF